MAKIVGYRVRQNEKFEIDGVETVLNQVELHVTQRSVGPRTAGVFAAVYKIQLNEFGYIFNIDMSKIQTYEEYLDTILNKECFIEKTLVGSKEKVCSIGFLKA